MNLLQATCARITPVSAAAAGAAQTRLDAKLKPRGSLGRLEEIACRIAAIRGQPSTELGGKAIIVMCADHGVAEEGVSAFPQSVTAQMVRNFAGGGAAINILARHAGAYLTVVDIGVKEDLPPLPGVVAARVAPGTQNFTRGPAMDESQAVAAMETGIRTASQVIAAGAGIVGLGEMGIANTTAAAALAAVFTGAEPSLTTGRGSGIGAATWRHKVTVVERAIATNAPDARRPLKVLAALGGLEIAGLAGVVLACSAERVPLVCDGFIAGVAALTAARLEPACAGYVIAAHRSAEPGHIAVLDALGAVPLLDLGLRLGEGTGAALAMGLIDAALVVLRDMATLTDGGVTDPRS